jgi:hypothetical protein
MPSSEGKPLSDDERLSAFLDTVKRIPPTWTCVKCGFEGRNAPDRYCSSVNRARRPTVLPSRFAGRPCFRLSLQSDQRRRPSSMSHAGASSAPCPLPDFWRLWAPRAFCPMHGRPYHERPPCPLPCAGLGRHGLLSMNCKRLSH